MLKQDKPLDLEVFKKIAFCLLSTIQSLHALNIVHLNLTCDNILVTDPKGLLENSESGSSGEQVVLEQKCA